jgi:uncharacterized membrane protein YgcG
MALIDSLDSILATFFLHGDRSTAKKATMLLSLLASRQANAAAAALVNVATDSSLLTFGMLLLDKLTSGVANLVRFKSAAAVRFYVSLIRQTMWLDSSKAYHSLMSMLGTLATGYVYEPTHSLLRTRLNLSSLVFDAKLFDVDLNTFLRLHAPASHTHNQRAATAAAIHLAQSGAPASVSNAGVSAQQLNSQQMQLQVQEQVQLAYQQLQSQAQKSFGGGAGGGAGGGNTFSFGTVSFGGGANPVSGNLISSWVRISR